MHLNHHKSLGGSRVCERLPWRNDTPAGMYCPGANSFSVSTHKRRWARRYRSVPGSRHSSRHSDFSLAMQDLKA